MKEKIFHIEDSGDEAEAETPRTPIELKVSRNSVSSQFHNKIQTIMKPILDHGALQPLGDNMAYYRHLLDVAGSFEQWHAAAHQLDRLEGKEQWKEQIECDDYDYQLVHSRLEQLRRAREGGDYLTMMFLLRSSLSRNLGDMGNPKLFHARVGTKKLIEDYHDEVIRQFMMLCEREEELDDKLEFFLNARQSLGRTALLLSGGATLGLYHFGVVKALYECRLLPRIISGSSIGSLIAALVCCKTDKELFRLLRDESLNLNVLESEEEAGSMFFKLSRFLKHGVFLDVEVLKSCIRDNIGDLTFHEAYNRTRRILNITVSSSTKYEMPRLLNYLTAPNVVIWSAVQASCAIPLVYKSAPLVAKDKDGQLVAWNPSGHRWIDGSVENDLPMTRLSELFNVNHFLVCQVNPHVVPFLQNQNELLSKVFFLLKSEVQHRVSQLIELDFFPTTLHRVQNILSQKYYGDITIVPDVKVKDYLSLMSNPTKEILWDAVIRGEKATWPKVSIIRNHCQIELLLDETIYRLRCRKLELAVSKFNEPLDHTIEAGLNTRSLSVGRMMNRLSHPKSPQITSTGSIIDLHDIVDLKQERAFKMTANMLSSLTITPMARKEKSEANLTVKSR